ncbi:MAG: hypothetical protein WA418_29775 [Bradyrhizobium sp.]
MPTASTSAIVTATAIQVARLEEAVSPEASRSCGAAGDGAAADPFSDPFVPAFGRLRVNACTSRPKLVSLRSSCSVGHFRQCRNVCQGRLTCIKAFLPEAPMMSFPVGGCQDEIINCPNRAVAGDGVRSREH